MSSMVNDYNEYCKYGTNADWYRKAEQKIEAERQAKEIPKIDIEKDWFSTAQKAIEYAKSNPGICITRASDGNGYIIKN